MTLENDQKQEPIAGLIYAGGRGQRMGGVDKALLEKDGAPLIAHMSRALAPYVSEILITRQKDQADLSAYGRVVFDDAPDEGPLAGLVAGISAARGYRYLLTSAVDADGLPPDYLTKLKAVARPHAMAMEDGQVHPTFALIDLAHADEILNAYARGGRSLRSWLTAVNSDYALFATGSFRNINQIG